MTSPKWWKKTFRHHRQKVSTCMACSWMALDGIEETAGLRNLCQKSCLPHFPLCIYSPWILLLWSKTRKTTKMFSNFTSALFTRNPDVRTWRTFSAWTLRLHSIPITGFYVASPCCVTQSSVVWQLFTSDRGKGRCTVCPFFAWFYKPLFFYFNSSRELV